MPGLYQAALDNLRITNHGGTRVPFYAEQTSFSFRYQGFRTATVLMIPRTDLPGTADSGHAMEDIYRASLAHRRMSAIRRGATFLAENYDRDGEPKLLPSLLKQAYATGDLKALREMRTVDFERQLDQGLAILQPLAPVVKKYTIHAVAYAHLDFIWLWPWDDTLNKARKDFEQVLKFMDEFPDFTFSYTSPALFEAIERQDPALFARIQKRAREGRWEMAGSRWCEADANLISEESHARQLLQAHRYNREKFGSESMVTFEPDAFDHPGFLPQILRKAGVRFYLSRQTSHPTTPFWWEGLDGSRVLAFPIHHYMDSLNGDVLDFCLTPEQRAKGWYDGLVVYGVGDHGGGPSRDEIQTGIELDRLPVYPSVKFSSFRFFLNQLATSPAMSQIPVVRGDMEFQFPGTYTVGGEIKRLNRACENTLTAAESWAAIAQTLGIAPPANRFDNAWRALLWAQHHDTIGGTIIPSSATYARKVLQDVLTAVSADLRQTLETLVANIKTKGISNRPQVVFNPVAWNTTAPVSLTIPDASKTWEWVDPSGEIHPIQTVTSDSTAATGVVVLNDLPSFGYCTGWLQPSEKSAEASLELQRRRPSVALHSSASEAMRAQGRFIEIEVSPCSGNITQLIHRSTGRNWVPAGRELGRFRVDYEKPRNMSAWSIGPIVQTKWLDRAESVECVEAGPVRVVFRSRYAFGQSRIEKDTILYRELGRLDFIARVDWRERGAEEKPAPMLRMEFPSPFKVAEARYLVPFGELRRPQDGTDYCASYGMGLSGANGSLCVFNNYKCAYSATNDVVRVTLLRSPYDPDPAPDVGFHTIPLALEITDQPWRSAGFSRHGMEFNRIPAVIPATPHDGRLPREQSFVSVEPSTTLVTALKAAYDSPSNLVLRIYQADGSPIRAKCFTTLPSVTWRETDLIERLPTNRTSIDPQSLALSAWEIKTLLLENHASDSKTQRH